jgi:hypothetical protein
VVCLTVQHPPNSWVCMSAAVLTLLSWYGPAASIPQRYAQTPPCEIRHAYTVCIVQGGVSVYRPPSNEMSLVLFMPSPSTVLAIRRNLFMRRGPVDCERGEARLARLHCTVLHVAGAVGCAGGHRLPVVLALPQRLHAPQSTRHLRCSTSLGPG